VEAQMNCIHTPKVRQWLSKFPGGMMFFLGCHLIDLILLIQGEPQDVYPFNTCTGTDGVTSKDFGFALLRYQNGISFAKTNAAELGGYVRRQLVVTGTKATVELKPLEMPVEGGGDQYTDRTVYTVSRPWQTPGVTTRSVPRDRYDTMMESFGKMALGEMENPYSYEYERLVYHTLMKACGKK